MQLFCYVCFYSPHFDQIFMFSSLEIQFAFSATANSNKVIKTKVASVQTKRVNYRTVKLKDLSLEWQ